MPVKNEHVRAFLLSCQENEQQLAGTEDNERRVSIYESLLMECKDALQILRDELKADPVSRFPLMTLFEEGYKQWEPPTKSLYQREKIHL